MTNSFRCVSRIHLFPGPDFVFQARLLSLTPLAIQNSFAMIHKSRIPDDVKRGFLFEQAVSRLASWWAFTFFTINPTGHLRSRTFEDVQRVLHSKGLVDISGKGKGKAFPQDVDSREDLFDDNEVEIVRSAKSLMKHALMRSGSRDVGSQLFTALCRALGIPTRLVVSLQSVPWQTNVGRSKTPAKQKGLNLKGRLSSSATRKTTVKARSWPTIYGKTATSPGMTCR
jgi:xeroderma pigmentosum group C-complementing protein